MTLDPAAANRVRLHVCARGIVQGVGFRPFVFRLAQRFRLSGWVRNDSEGVKIQAEGHAESAHAFLKAIEDECPPLARIEALNSQEIEPCFDREFVIRESEARPGDKTLISPDVSICGDCLRELFDPTDRRFRYPFINCTNCGPRYTIILETPYDRPNTTMRPFEMCAACEREYHDPRDRRFHAQPNACAACGPHVWLADGSGRDIAGDAAVQQAQRLLREGRIVAVKGIGGFHLAADADNDAAVRALRERKRREQKPLAVMCQDLGMVRRFCCVSEQEAQLLCSPQRPIVLLRKRPGAGLAPSVAPKSQYFGVMLPCAPLHYLLLADGFSALVMTSGNLSGEPIAIDNSDAVERLRGVADAFLLHDRDIHLRSDDSVCRVDRSAASVLRRSRGYAPTPLALASGPAVLGVGAELKSAVCVARGKDAFVSQHIGDLKNQETLLFFRKTIEHLERLFDVHPGVIAHDMHPDYLSTRYAQARAALDPKLLLVPVQHHFAHVASCMAEHGLDEKVIGVAFDGTGFGLDRAVWGGEFFVADPRGFDRAAHLRYVPLPGGDAAVQRPGRMAISYLLAAFGPQWRGLDLPLAAHIGPEEASVVETIARHGVNSPPTSSMGRLFDAVSALCGVAFENAYEGQAAMELEASLDENETSEYHVGVGVEAGCLAVEGASIVRAVAEDLVRGTSAGRVAARFHRTLVRVMVDICLRIREKYGVDAVCLTGGVFQNQHLVEWGGAALEHEGFRVFGHCRVPANDGGIAFGQAAVARALCAGREMAEPVRLPSEKDSDPCV